MAKSRNAAINDINDRLSEIARTLARINALAVAEQPPCSISPAARTPAPAPADRPDRLTIARAWVHAHNARDKVFGTDLFFDPAWHMLLDLYINYCEDYQVSVSSLCLASRVPGTTALRWLTNLIDRGLAVRIDDPFDRRRVFVQMTELAIQRVEAVLDGAAESDRRLGVERLRRTQ